VQPGHCPVCTGPLQPGTAGRRRYCSTWCGVRASGFRDRGWLALPAAA
jgi:hypothetical protein